MEQELKEFQVGQLVFAKVKGYPSWPAKITQRNEKSYGVFFYGTNETASMSAENIFAYEENKKKLINAKSLRWSFFKEAVNESETIFNLESNVASKSTDNQLKPDLKRKSNFTVEDYAGAASQPAKRMFHLTPAVSDPTEDLEGIGNNNLLLAYVKPNSYIGINLEYKKPKVFPSKLIRCEWEAAANKRAEVLKYKLENKLTQVNSVLHRVVITPPRELIINDFLRRFLAEITPKQKVFYVQLYDFFQNHKLRQLLDVENIINNNKGGIVWNRFEKHERIPLMLLQHPKVMGNIRRSRLFYEDIRPFNLIHCNHSKSTPAVEKIRQDAVDIYKNLKTMFKEKDLTLAWDILCEKINNFRDCVIDTDDEIFLSVTTCTYMKILAEREDFSGTMHIKS
ncbi:uncharacterized protein LOC119688703 [Teleopsis dalmanni]|uniref:uncharacterized protein LOC119688703 n=1 Tax=Teleopsis dalmanni TaxID=139649 RepID=UPI0018CDA298|nr:uncharacterized protein LOC119688703 [Teleopsis dalmanni]